MSFAYSIAVSNTNSYANAFGFAQSYFGNLLRLRRLLPQLPRVAPLPAAHKAVHLPNHKQRVRANISDSYADGYSYYNSNNYSNSLPGIGASFHWRNWVWLRAFADSYADGYSYYHSLPHLRECSV